MAGAASESTTDSNFQIALRSLQPRVPALLDPKGKPYFHLSSLWHFYERPYGFPIELFEPAARTRFTFYLAPVLFALEFYEPGRSDPVLRIEPANKEDIVPLTDRLQTMLLKDENARRVLLGRSDAFDSRSFVAVLWIPVVDDPFRRLVSIEGFLLSFHGLVPHKPLQEQLGDARVMASYEQRWPTIVPADAPRDSPRSQASGDLSSELVAKSGVPPFHTAALHRRLEQMHASSMSARERDITAHLAKAAAGQHPPMAQPTPWKCDSLAPTLPPELVKAYQHALPSLDLSGAGAVPDVPEPPTEMPLPQAPPDTATVPVPLFSLIFDGLDGAFWFGCCDTARDELRKQWSGLEDSILSEVETFRLLLASSDFTRLA